MGQKSHKTHAKKKEIPLPELFPPSSSAAPINASFATAAQLFPHTGMDDAQLRRLGHRDNLNPATGAPWVPAPVRGQYPVTPTILGAFAWLRAQHERAPGIPATCRSMTHFEETFGWPAVVLQYASANGAAAAFKSNNTVEVLPVIRFYAQILKVLCTGGGAKIEGMKGFESFDLDLQRAKSTAEDVIQKKRENALANQHLLTIDLAEKIWSDVFATIAADWKNFEKITGGEIKSLLKGAGVPAEVITRVLEIATAAIAKPMAKLNAHSQKQQQQQRDVASPQEKK